jgi:hypothetical protein
VPAGRYDFAPGEELQHDTSPHELELGGRKRKVQTASAVLCYSRMLFFQCYPTFRRFDCKVFLTEALRYFGGAAARTMIDNTHVVVLRGSGRDMVPVLEMAAFGERFGFQFIETNFLAGRTFHSWEDLNQRAREWCDKVNATYKKHIRAVPRELFALPPRSPAGSPRFLPDLSLRAAPSHPGKSGDCPRPLLRRRSQASSKSGGLATPIRVTRP